MYTFIKTQVFLWIKLETGVIAFYFLFKLFLLSIILQVNKLGEYITSTMLRKLVFEWVTFNNNKQLISYKVN